MASPCEPRAKTGYDTDRFLHFYKEGLDYIIALNRRGIDLAEAYATLLLTKILTPFPTRFVDLQSPAGAGISVAVYNYDGDVYASDEARMLAEMGDRTFRLGNSDNDDYRTIFGSEVLRDVVESSIVEVSSWVRGLRLPALLRRASQSFTSADAGRPCRSPSHKRVLQTKHGDYSVSFLPPFHGRTGTLSNLFCVDTAQTNWTGPG